MPPQTIISVPVHTAVCELRASGTLVVLGALHLSVVGYQPPVFTRPMKGKSPMPPQTIISVPVQIAVCERRAAGALLVVVAVQLSVPGLYRPPVFKSVKKSSTPPQTIISLPARTAVCRLRPSGAFVVLVGAQVFVAGLYLPPVLTREGKPAVSPPQTIISVPVHTAVWFARALGAP